MSATSGGGGVTARKAYGRRELARVLKGMGYSVSPEGLDQASMRLRQIAARGAVTSRTLRLIAADAGLGRVH